MACRARSVLEAFKVAIAKDSIDTDMAVIGPRIQNLISKVKEAKLADNAEAQANKKATEGYLNTLKKNGAKTMSNGLVYQVLENGNGAKVNASDIVNVVITVTDKNGTVLQSTNGEPQQMPASQFGQIHPMLAEAHHSNARWRPLQILRQPGRRSSTKLQTLRLHRV